MTLYDLLPLLRQQEPYNRLLDLVRRGSHPWVVGPAGAEKAYLLAALAEISPSLERWPALSKVGAPSCSSHHPTTRRNGCTMTCSRLPHRWPARSRCSPSGTPCARTVNVRPLKPSVSGRRRSCVWLTAPRRGSSHRSRRCCASFPHRMTCARQCGASGKASTP